MPAPDSTRFDRTYSIGTGGRAGLALLLAFTVAIGFVAPAIGQVDVNTTIQDPAEVDFGVDGVHDTFMNETVLTKAKHDMAWGADEEGFRTYEDDNGDEVTGAFEVNTTSDVDTGHNVNPYNFSPALIDEDSYEAFPRGSAGASALDASEWNKNKNAGNVTIQNTTIASGVNAVQIDTGTNSDGTGTITTEVGYANWTTELDSDESKRVAIFAGDIETLEAGANVSVNITDESGDYKRLRIDSSENVDANSTIMANSTGPFVYQVKLATVPTSGSGTFDNIESINISVQTSPGAASGTGDADIRFSWIDLERKTMIDLAEKQVDSDGDGDFDDFNTTTNVTDSTGYIRTHSLTSLDPIYDDATLRDVEAPVTWNASLVDDEDFRLESENATDHPGFDRVVTQTVRLHVPSAIDLSHGNLVLRDTVELPNSRYLDSQVVEDADQSKSLSKFGITNGSDPTNTYSGNSQGDVIDLDTSVSAGDDYVVVVQYKVTNSEWSNMVPADDGAGAAAPAEDGGGGGLVGFLTSVPGMILSAGAALVVIFRRRIFG